MTFKKYLFEKYKLLNPTVLMKLIKVVKARVLEELSLLMCKSDSGDISKSTPPKLMSDNCNCSENTGPYRTVSLTLDIRRGAF